MTHKMTRRLLILLVTAALAEGALSACAPSDRAPIEYNVREVTVAVPLRDVYSRLLGRMNACPSVNSLLSPPEVAGTIARDQQSARVAMVQRSRGHEEALWGANLATVAQGTKMSMFTARYRGVGNVEWLMQAWAQGRDPQRFQDGFDFVVC
jgi:hypothetical protein